MIRAARPTGFLLTLTLTATAYLVGAGAETPQRRVPLHMAFTSAMFAGVSFNDAKAAMDVWVETIARGRGVQLDATTTIYKNLNELRMAIDAGDVHLVSLSVEQYRQLARPQFGTVLLGGNRGRYREEFILSVRNGGATSLAGLKGKRLAVAEGPGYDVSMAWLRSIVSAAGLGPVDKHFGSVTTFTKTSRAVLPVFFGQQDACLTSRRGFDLVTEMNPQVGRTLTAINTSPPVVPGLLLFDLRYDPSVRAAVLAGVLSLHETPRGQQVLSLFAVDRMIEGTASDLAPALQLLTPPAGRATGG